ncbi:MAG TPA: hypothetical protein VF210_00145 [Pseudomonadales bacterium]
MTGETYDPEAVFWNRVLTLSEAVEAADSTQAIEDHLRALEEGFSGAFDPVDSFQAYVTLTLCRALRRRLEQLTRT